MTGKSGKENSKDGQADKPAPALERTVETRKIQRSGRGSTVLSLPQEGVGRVGLKPGDPVALHFQPDGSFVLSPRLVESTSRLKATLEIDPKRPARTSRQGIAGHLRGEGPGRPTTGSGRAWPSRSLTRARLEPCSPTWRARRTSPWDGACAGCTCS